MSHTTHIATHKHLLDMRWEILRAVREFFWSQGFIEVETPLILRLPGQEPYLSPMQIDIHDESKKVFPGFLHTSPEYTMKKMLAAGYEKIFSLGKVFRDEESFGGTHNPEFTMIEWYRANENFEAIMDDCEMLFKFILAKLSPYQGELEGVFSKSSARVSADPTSPPLIGEEKLRFTRLHMREAWQKFAGVNLDDYLEREKMLALCRAKGYAPHDDEPYEDLFYRIFLNEIEPKLATLGAVIIHHYPIQMAALSRKSDTDPRYAERFELYFNGLELANAFGELTDPEEQRARLAHEQEVRKQAGKAVFPIDNDFIDAVGQMPQSAGIALGIDRLVQVFTSCQNINDVIPLPASLLFEKIEEPNPKSETNHNI